MTMARFTVEFCSEWIWSGRQVSAVPVESDLPTLKRRLIERRDSVVFKATSMALTSQ